MDVTEAVVDTVASSVLDLLPMDVTEAVVDTVASPVGGPAAPYVPVLISSISLAVRMSLNMTTSSISPP